MAVLCLVPIGFISAQTEPVPSWIRSNAGLWADEAIDDQTFLAGIGFLIENGIIQVDRIQQLEEENEVLRNELLSLQLSIPARTIEHAEWSEVSAVEAPDGSVTELETTEPWVLERSNRGEYLYRVSHVDGPHVEASLVFSFSFVDGHDSGYSPDIHPATKLEMEDEKKLARDLMFSQSGIDFIESGMMDMWGRLLEGDIHTIKQLEDNSVSVLMVDEAGYAALMIVGEDRGMFITVSGHGYEDSLKEVMEHSRQLDEGFVYPHVVCVNDIDTDWRISFNVELYADGNKLAVPAHVGFTEGGCQRALYTLANGGVAYAEWSEEHTFEIGHFLWIAEFPIADMELSDSALYVNGVKSEQFLRHPIEEGMTYRFEFTTKSGN